MSWRWNCVEVPLSSARGLFGLRWSQWHGALGKCSYIETILIWCYWLFYYKLQNWRLRWIILHYPTPKCLPSDETLARDIHAKWSVSETQVSTAADFTRQCLIISFRHYGRPSLPVAQLEGIAAPLHGNLHCNSDHVEGPKCHTTTS